MFRDYAQAMDKVIEYLIKNDYGITAIYAHKRCFRLLKEHLEDAEADYSNELAIQWLSSNAKKLNHNSFKNYRLALSRLNDVLEKDGDR